MANILVRNVKDQTIKRLKTRAKRNGRSFQSEARLVMDSAAEPTIAEMLSKARRWRKKLGRSFSDSVEIIREDRDR